MSVALVTEYVVIYRSLDIAQEIRLLCMTQRSPYPTFNFLMLSSVSAQLPPVFAVFAQLVSQVFISSVVFVVRLTLGIMALTRRSSFRCSVSAAFSLSASRICAVSACIDSRMMGRMASTTSSREGIDVNGAICPYAANVSCSSRSSRSIFCMSGSCRSA